MCAPEKGKDPCADRGENGSLRARKKRPKGPYTPMRKEIDRLIQRGKEENYSLLPESLIAGGCKSKKKESGAAGAVRTQREGGSRAPRRRHKKRGHKGLDPRDKREERSGVGKKGGSIRSFRRSEIRGKEEGKTGYYFGPRPALIDPERRKKLSQKKKKLGEKGRDCNISDQLTGGETFFPRGFSLQNKKQGESGTS